MLISKIIPVFNKKRTIKDSLIKINKINNLYEEIIIIDDCSTDLTHQIIFKELKNQHSKIIYLDKNYEKGYVLRKGFEVATGEIIIIQDADLEYNPNDYYKLLDPIINYNSEVVYGSRVMPGGVRVRTNSINT